MAKNVVINNVTYQSVPSVDIPQSGGGTAKFYDTTPANVTANDIRSGVKAYGADGEIQGNLAEVSCSTTNITSKAQQVSVPAGIHDGTQKLQISSAEQAKIIAGNIKKGVSILGVDGALSSASITQDSSTKVLTIS